MKLGDRKLCKEVGGGGGMKSGDLKLGKEVGGDGGFKMHKARGNQKETLGYFFCQLQVVSFVVKE